MANEGYISRDEAAKIIGVKPSWPGFRKIKNGTKKDETYKGFGRKPLLYLKTNIEALANAREAEKSGKAEEKAKKLEKKVKATGETRPITREEFKKNVKAAHVKKVKARKSVSKHTARAAKQTKMLNDALAASFTTSDVGLSKRIRDLMAYAKSKCPNVTEITIKPRDGVSGVEEVVKRLYSVEAEEK